MAQPRARALSLVDINFIGTALFIAAIGCLLIYSATYFTDPTLDILRKQLLWVGIGFALMIVFMVVDYHVFFEIAPFLYAIGNVLLVYLLLWGKLTAHVKSWIHIGTFQFQPSEFMKIFTALMLARYFENHQSVYLDVRAFLRVMLIIGIPVGLIAVEPDLGTALSFLPLIAVAMFFGGIKWKVWVAAVLIALILLPIGWVLLKPYQKDRIITFLNPDRDPLGKGYQVTQAKIAIGSGGIHGKGFKQGTQAKLEYLPARHTDFIFAAVGERWGFVGAALVLSLYGLLISRALRMIVLAKDLFGSLVAAGVAAMLSFQVFVNVGMTIGIMPITGVTLPLMSYGGSSVITTMLAIGLLQSIYVQARAAQAMKGRVLRH